MRMSMRIRSGFEKSNSPEMFSGLSLWANTSKFSNSRWLFTMRTGSLAKRSVTPYGSLNRWAESRKTSPLIIGLDNAPLMANSPSA